MKTIDFCIPFIGSGLPYAEFLVSNLYSTADYPERISISVSVHSAVDAKLLKTSSFKHLINRRVAHKNVGLPIGSAHHCCAIQSLFEQATADIVIFSDHDMAFLVKGWDTKITEILDNHDLCGVEYPNATFPITLKNYSEMKIIARNYQQTPNLSFLAITRKCIQTYFREGISFFHHYLDDGGLQLQFVNTREMAEALCLPLGTFWYMDSGFEIPFVIQRNKLRYHTFTHSAFDVKNLFSSDESIESQSTLLASDLFKNGLNGEPFLAHYRAGTIKSSEPNNKASFDRFMAVVNTYLAK